MFADESEDELLEHPPQRNSMVAASPVVRSLASGFALYSTNTLRGDLCTPQLNAFTPPPTTTMRLGSGTRSCTIFPSAVLIATRACFPRQSNRSNTPSTLASGWKASYQPSGLGAVAPFGFSFLLASSSAARIAASLCAF